MVICTKPKELVMLDRRQFKGVSLFRIFKNLIETELKEIEEYINECSSELEKKQQNLNDAYQKANSEIEADDEYDPDIIFGEDINKYYKVFPIYTYNPLLLTLYGQFENWLKRLCDLDSRKGFSNIKISDLSGNNYIDKSRRYLELVSEIDLASNDRNWMRITEIQKIRNCIAHNNSNIKKNKSQPTENQECYNILANDSRISLDTNTGDFYIKDKSFLLEVICLIKDYLLSIIEKLAVRKVVAKNITMPFNNDNWGQEKSEELLKSIIGSLNLLDLNETRIDEFKDSDLKSKLKGELSSMCWNLTKLLAFFTAGEWSAIDKDLIVEEREDGLIKLKKIYGIR